jgi:hypothetical protein
MASRSLDSVAALATLQKGDQPAKSPVFDGQNGDGVIAAERRTARLAVPWK